ncbi:MAG: EthD family reductase [Syntrophomonadaceae bacterium]|nr:EthD family reductase [Syntrophomonadaceae bacterium]
MVKIGSFYPNGEGATFDMKYYCEVYVPLLREWFGEALKKVVVDQGIYGGEPDAPPFFRAMGQFYFDTEEEGVSAYFSNLSKMAVERPNFTNITPIIQISQVIVEE